LKSQIIHHWHQRVICNSSHIPMILQVCKHMIHYLQVSNPWICLIL
jgi:hypothetical protein